MESELDVNKLAAEFLQANLESAWSLLTSQVKGARNTVRSKFERTYRSYLERLLDRYSRGKSFFVRSEPVPLYEFFVPLDLATQRRVLRKPSAIDIAAVAPNSIISGSGGSGKTMMMRHILISTIAERSKTPIFLELRQLNQSEEGVRSALLRTLQTNGLDVDDAYFEVALAAGHFSIMLDGFDELQHSRRKSVAREIKELAERYRGNWFIMSSRPDPELEGWGPFIQFRLQPLDLDRAVDLVLKLPFDDPIKIKFVADLRENLFARHESFLSNPLLLSIMLLTYSDVAHIPNKLSIFYNQAYESLFHKHDALKGGFQRDRRSGLDIQDFGRAFAAFCMQSYDSREFAFSHLRALELLDHGRKITQLVYESQAILDDALQAICLLVEEGIEITFSHRSFQEYFVARFIASCPPEVKPKLVKRVTPDARSDTVMALLYELDPYTVEQNYILPALEGVRKRIGLVRDVGIGHFLRYIKFAYDTFHFGGATQGNMDHRLLAMVGDSESYSAIRFAAQCYGIDPLDKELAGAAYQKVQDAFLEEFGKTSVSTKSLTARNRFVRVLFESRGYWGGDRLRAVLMLVSIIKQRHQDTQRSLNAILAADRDHQLRSNS
jgi:NACHT domain